MDRFTQISTRQTADKEGIKREINKTKRFSVETLRPASPRKPSDVQVL